MELTQSNMSFALERDAGSTLAAIGARHGLSYQRVQGAIKDIRMHLTWVELELLKARRTGEAVGLVIPHQAQEERQTALDYLDFMVRKLRESGVEVEVEHRPTTEGSAFFLFDRTDWNGES